MQHPRGAGDGIERVSFLMFGWARRSAKATGNSADVAKASPAASTSWLREADRLSAEKNYAAARSLYERVLADTPDNQYALYQLAGALEGLGALDAAARACDRGLELSPDQPALLHRRGGIAFRRQQFVLALEIFQRLKALHPDFPLIDAMIADQLASLGRGNEAIEAFDRALAVAPDAVRLQSDRLFVLNYFGLLSREELFEQHRRWGAAHEAQLRPHWRPHGQSRDPERKLRLGYVSADLRQHAVAYFIEGVLQNHDRRRFEVHAFDVSPYAADDVTTRLSAYCDHWHRLGESSDDEVARVIRERQIDVLVDLSGHTAYNRLLVFARRPAPVQVGWFGYMNTTGLTSIDYRLTDASLDPPGISDDFYTEELVRLPAAACFQPDPGGPEVGELPAIRNGYIRMASVNQWTKVTDTTKDVWTRILRDLPNARLVVVARGGSDAAVRASITSEFVRRGAAPGQIEVVEFRPIRSFLAFLNDIDFALDPFPYGGGTTSLHTTWMGVPIVTLESESELGRSTPNILRTLGAGELVAHDVEAYRTIALNLAGDVARLQGYRRELRERFRRSPLMDSVPLTRNVEAAFRMMWRRYCAVQEAL